MSDYRNTDFTTTEKMDYNIPSHRALSEEYAFYHAVREGNLDYVRKNCEEHSFANPEGMGVLSKNPLTNFKYHFCVTAALLTRHCIEGGLEIEQAFRLSDYYISSLDQLMDVQSVIEWHDKMVLDFTGKMHLSKTYSAVSTSIQNALDYIYSHISEQVTLTDIAKHVALSPCYLSRLFIKETGSSVKDYILQMKIEKAQNLLKYSDSSSADIAQFLSFSSQSHFISTFKHYSGMTPKKYRDSYARKVW